jgi:hypothetical protein
MFREINIELDVLKQGIMSLLTFKPLTNKQKELIYLDESEKDLFNQSSKNFNSFVIYEKMKDFSSTACKIQNLI